MSDDYKKYPFDEIESRWQRRWDEEKTYRVPNPGDPDFDPSKPKYYVLDMFPYPSGDGLHVGHPEGYTATDIVARYKRRNGFNVLHPMGWDAFGLPAEQYAIKTGQHPRITTESNVDRFREQLKSIGFCYDWDREVNTTDPGYFKWTQWIFLQFYNSYFDRKENKAKPVAELESQGLGAEEINERRLAFVSEEPVNWCPELGTVLANEEVVDGKSEVGGHPVERRPMRQWKLRITEYAQRLIDELDELDWPEGIKKRQIDWIGRSEGADVDFPVEGLEETLTVYTTRPDTLFGATYMVLAPEHPLVDGITTDAQREAVDDYLAQVARKSDRDREEAKEKTGVFTGGYAVNPVNDEKIPIWIADYVLISYGTGAIMAVPAHDERDFEFAEKFELPIIQVVEPPDDSDWRGFVGHGTSVNSSELLNGLPTAEAKEKITRWLEEQGRGKKAINYKLRDWLFARQRYWGEPFPIVWEDGRHRALDASELPVEAPEMEDYKPTGGFEAPLSKARDWIRYSDTATRETITMPQWAGSCWYYLRFCDARNPDRFAGEEAERYWMGDRGVDLYVGGTEHAVLHLLYARFWHKLLYDLGHVSTREPFHRLVNQGMILGEVEITGYKNANGDWVSSEFAKETDDGIVHKESGEALEGVRIDSEDAEKAKGKDDAFVLVADRDIRLVSRAYKMSKSRGNVVNPDHVITEYGADSLRLYEMFMGPLEQTKPWSTKGVEGVHRFIGRVWRLVMDSEPGRGWTVSEKVTDSPAAAELDKVVHETIRKVTQDTESLSFNTAISQMMILANELSQSESRPLAAVVSLLTVLNPYAPHVTEDLYSRLQQSFADLPAALLSEQQWPAWDEAKLVQNEVELGVQVNGKLRDRITVSVDESNEAIEAKALASERVQGFIDGKTVRKVIVVPKRIVNIVAN